MKVVSIQTLSVKGSVAATCALALLTIAGSSSFAATSTAAKKAAIPAQSISAHRAASITSSTEDVTLDFVAADINDVLKALAVQTGQNIVSSADVKGTITVSLAHVTLEQALDMVARLSGYQYIKANNAYIVGTPSGIAAYSNPSNGAPGPTETVVVTTHYASTDDVASLLKLRYPDLQTSTGTAITGTRVGTSTQAIVLSGPQDEVDQAKALIESFESNLATQVASETTTIYTVQYTSLGDLINILNTLVPSVVVTPGPGQGFKTSAPSAAAAASSSSASAVGTSSSGGSSGGSSSSGGGGATGSSQSSTTGPTTLLLTGTAADIQKAIDLLTKVDVKPKQLLFEAKVTEINDSDQDNLGLNWNFTNASTSIGELLHPGETSSTNPLIVDYPGQILKFGTFGRTPITTLATVSLDALISTGRAKLLADPNIAALDGFPAQVFIGDTVNYIQSISQTTTGQNVTTASVQVGVILRVTGKTSSDGYITLNIHPEVSSISQFTQVPGGGELPDIATRFADTTIRVKDGDTVAIGGLIQQNDIDNISKVPFFGDLPFFGKFFQDNKLTKQKTEVVFFLKTSIMPQS